MTQEQIISDNKLIAEFMGLKWEHEYPEELRVVLNEGEFGEYRPLAQYHVSWDWLMPVVDKIENIEGGQFDVSINWDKTSVIDWRLNKELVVVETGIKVTNTYLAICDFLKLYNEQNNP